MGAEWVAFGCCYVVRFFLWRERGLDRGVCSRRLFEETVRGDCSRGLFTLVTTYAVYAHTQELVTKVRDAVNYPQWYWLLAGMLALMSGMASLVGLVIPVVGLLGALWTVVHFLVAIASHLARADWANAPAPLIFLVTFAFLVWLRWDDIQSDQPAFGL